MHTRTDEAPRHGRPRKEETQRRRKDRLGVIGNKLAVNESLLNFSEFTYRWVNDTPARIFAKTKEDDWDIVHQDGTEVKDGADLGSAVSQVVGSKKDGSPLVAYLCRKPVAWHEADQAEKMRDLDTQLAELRRGNSRDGAKQADYVPAEGIRI